MSDRCDGPSQDSLGPLQDEDEINGETSEDGDSMDGDDSGDLGSRHDLFEGMLKEKETKLVGNTSRGAHRRTKRECEQLYGQWCRRHVSILLIET